MTCQCHDAIVLRRIVIVLCLLGLFLLAYAVWPVHPLLSLATWFSGAPVADYWS